MIKSLLALLVLPALAGASTLFISFDDANPLAFQGTTISFTGTVSNPGGGDETFINSGGVDLLGLFTSHFDVNDYPISLLSPETSSPLTLFTLDIDPNAPAGVYNGILTLLGGVDGDAQDVIASQTFSVTLLAPEPSTWLLSLPLLLLLPVRRWLNRATRRVAA